jgi:uncharacterized protein
MSDSEFAPEPSEVAVPGPSDGQGSTVLKFIVDVNVGKLAKWLRILGYDALFINPIEDGTLVEIALREGRVILTKDTHIAERRLVTGGQVRVVLVEGDRLQEQLRFLVARLGLKGPFRLFSRCLECNLPLVDAERSAVKELVPPFVYRTQTHYMACPRCGRIYWPGTHWQRMRATAQQLMDPNKPQ